MVLYYIPIYMADPSLVNASIIALNCLAVSLLRENCHRMKNNRQIMMEKLNQIKMEIMENEFDGSLEYKPKQKVLQRFHSHDGIIKETIYEK